MATCFKVDKARVPIRGVRIMLPVKQVSHRRTRRLLCQRGRFIRVEYIVSNWPIYHGIAKILRARHKLSSNFIRGRAKFRYKIYRAT